MEFESAQGLMGVDVHSKLRTNDGAAIYKAALAGSGIAVLPDYLTEKALRKGELVEVLKDFRIPDIWLKALVPASRIELPRIRMLLDWLEIKLKPLPPWKT